MPDGPDTGDRHQRLLTAERQIEEAQARLAEATRILADTAALGVSTKSEANIVALCQETLESLHSYRDLLRKAMDREQAEGR